MYIPNEICGPQPSHYIETDLYVFMSWPEDMDRLWIKFFSYVSVFCSANLKLFHDSPYRQKVEGDINSLNLLVQCSTKAAFSICH